MSCLLKQGTDGRFVLVVNIDGQEIGTRCCYTRTDAISQAGFLFERLTEEGWTVAAGMPQAALH